MTDVHIRDFAPADLESTIRLEGAADYRAFRQPAGIDDIVHCLVSRHPAVVAVSGDAIVAAAISRLDGDRARVLRLLVPHNLRRDGVGTTLLEEFERNLRARGIRRITALHPSSAAGSADYPAAGFEERSGLVHFEKRLRENAALNGFESDVPPPGLWGEVAGMVRGKSLIERRVLLPLAHPNLAAQHHSDRPGPSYSSGRRAPARPPSRGPSPASWPGRSSNCARQARHNGGRPGSRPGCSVQLLR